MRSAGSMNCHGIRKFAVRWPLVMVLLGLVAGPRAAAQEAIVEFENFFADFAMFDEYSGLPGPLITGGSNVGVGGSGGLTLPGKHALTYTPLSFAFAGHGDAVTTSTFFKTGNLAPPTGFNETIGHVYVTSEPSGNPFQFLGSNDFFASVYRGSHGAYIGISGQTSTGSFWPFLETPVTLASNRWYELSATFTSNQQTSLDATFRVTDYGANGTTSLGVVGTASASFSGQSTALTDATWYGGFGADADNGVKADRFRLDVPGTVGGPATLSIEPTYDVTYWPGGSTRFYEGETELTIDGGEAQFPVLNVLAEFDLRDIPANAEVTAASLVIEPSFVQNPDMAIRARGYAGNGQRTNADPGFPQAVLGQSTETLLSGVDNVIDLDAAYIESLLGSATHLGLLLESTTAGPYAAIVASEATSGTPPTLMIEYALPSANGDFDGDEDVDGNDFLVWQRGQSPRPGTAADLTEWRTNFGRAEGTVRSASVPEPVTGALMAWATMVPLIWRRSARTNS